jgi:pilus assembly protein Flp/PilA
MTSAGRTAHDRGNPRWAPVRAPAQSSPGEAGQSFTTSPGDRDKEEPMLKLWNDFVQDESGQGLVEYVLIIALVAIGLILALTIFRNSIATIFGKISTTLDDNPNLTQ